MAYFDTKSGSLEEAIRQAVGGQINEAKVVMDLENDDPKLMKDIKGFGLKVKDLGDSGNKGYNEYEISGPQSKIDAASKKLNLQASYHEKLDPVNKSAAKKKFDDRKDKDIDNDGDVDSSDKFLHKRRKAIGKALNNADDFKPHMMYDPKTGKGYEAKKMDDHLRMKKMGYTHEKPKMEAYEMGTKEYADHTKKITPGQTTEDWNKQVDMMQEKNNSMRSILADMWGVNEGKNPFEKDEEKKASKKEDKTMTGKPATKVSVDPDMKEKKN